MPGTPHIARKKVMVSASPPTEMRAHLTHQHQIPPPVPDYGERYVGDTTDNSSVSSDEERIMRQDDEGASISEGSDSKSSGSLDTAEMLARHSGLPCGMTMVHVMIILILVPVAFLVAYTAIPLDAAVQSESFLSWHHDVFLDILEAGTYLQEERRDASLFLGAASNSTAAAEYKVLMDKARATVDKDLRNVMRRMRNSDIVIRDAFLAETERLLTTLSYYRQQTEDRHLTGHGVRYLYLLHIENVYGLLLYMNKDHRIYELESRVFIFYLLRRLQNTIDQLRAVGTGFILRDGHDLENLEDIEAMHIGVERDVLLIEHEAKPEALIALHEFLHDPKKLHLDEMMEKILTNDPAQYGSISVDDWLTTANDVIVAMHARDQHVLDIIVNGDILHEHAVEEGMKMFGAILACVIASVFVIWLNTREQERMEKALKSARTLSKAVQKFVPKNQLKTMGVRSITQVHSGLQTEVAQTMVYSQIRDFTGMSEKMSNAELFDWLQEYVSRMTKVTVAEHGYIDKFIGDALFCVFPQPTNGMRASTQMHVSTDQLNLELVNEGQANMVSIGVGLHYGLVIAGVFGDATRLSCTMVASDVNLASQLETLTKPYGAKIISSEAVIRQIDISQFCLRCVGRIRVAGSSKPIAIFDVFQTDNLPLKQFKTKTLREFERAIKISEKDPATANAVFERLSAAAKALGLRDVAVDRRIGGSNAAIDEADTSNIREAGRDNVGGGASPSMGAMANFAGLDLSDDEDKKKRKRKKKKKAPQTGFHFEDSDEDEARDSDSDFGRYTP